MHKIEYPKIEKNVPFQQRRERGGWVAFIRTMDVGDSCVVSLRENTAMRQASYRAGIKLASRKIGDNKYRVHRIE